MRAQRPPAGGAQAWHQLLHVARRQTGTWQNFVALVREIAEKLGCGVTGLEPLGRFAAPAANEVARRLLADVFAGELVGSIVAAAEIETIDWLDLQKPELPLAPLLETAVLPALR